jgi:nitrite reductase/ring-hydroxylating ferredoxin subunit
VVETCCGPGLAEDGRGTPKSHNKQQPEANQAQDETQGVTLMAEKFVAKLSEFKDGDRRIVFVGDNEIGVFRHDGEFYAYSNFCLHQGGPACEGLTIARVEERLRPDKTSMGLYFSEDEMHFVCPWHGMEYDMRTGECVANRKLKLKKYKTVQKGKGEDLYVVA